MKAAYSAYGIRRPHGYYGVITDSLAEQVKAAENAEGMPEEVADLIAAARGGQQNQEFDYTMKL